MLSFNELRYLAHNSKQANDKDNDAMFEQLLAAEQAANPMPRMGDLERFQVDLENRRGAPDVEPTTGGYLGATGMGAGIGAVAGIPAGLLAHALMAGEDKKSLRDYLKSGLLGGLIGGGTGALGGAGVRALANRNSAPAAALATTNNDLDVAKREAALADYLAGQRGKSDFMGPPDLLSYFTR